MIIINMYCVFWNPELGYSTTPCHKCPLALMLKQKGMPYDDASVQKLQLDLELYRESKCHEYDTGLIRAIIPDSLFTIFLYRRNCLCGIQIFDSFHAALRFILSATCSIIGNVPSTEIHKVANVNFLCDRQHLDNTDVEVENVWSDLTLYERVKCAMDNDLLRLDRDADLLLHLACLDPDFRLWNDIQNLAPANIELQPYGWIRLPEHKNTEWIQSAFREKLPAVALYRITDSYRLSCYGDNSKFMDCVLRSEFRLALGAYAISLMQNILRINPKLKILSRAVDCGYPLKAEVLACKSRIYVCNEIQPETSYLIFRDWKTIEFLLRHDISPELFRESYLAACVQDQVSHRLLANLYDLMPDHDTRWLGVTYAAACHRENLDFFLKLDAYDDRDWLRLVAAKHTTPAATEYILNHKPQIRSELDVETWQKNFMVQMQNCFLTQQEILVAVTAHMHMLDADTIAQILIADFHVVTLLTHSDFFRNLNFQTCVDKHTLVANAHKSYLAAVVYAAPALPDVSFLEILLFNSNVDTDFLAQMLQSEKGWPDKTRLASYFMPTATADSEIDCCLSHKSCSIRNIWSRYLDYAIDCGNRMPARMQFLATYHVFHPEVMAVLGPNFAANDADHVNFYKNT